MEMAILNIKKDKANAFEKDFKIASQYIISCDGYLSHQLKKCIEVNNQYLLLVHWESIEDHEIGFRGSSKYIEWKRLLHHYYDPFPTVEHYISI